MRRLIEATTSLTFNHYGWKIKLCFPLGSPNPTGKHTQPKLGVSQRQAMRSAREKFPLLFIHPLDRHVVLVVQVIFFSTRAQRLGFQIQITDFRLRRGDSHFCEKVLQALA